MVANADEGRRVSADYLNEVEGYYQNGVVPDMTFTIVVGRKSA
jgi:hypothetical protein